MKAKLKYVSLAGLLLGMLFLSAGPCFAKSAIQEYWEAKRSAKRGQKDFAFMHYRSILREYPSSKYKDQALFANGEYYYINFDYRQSKKYFEQFLEVSGDQNGKLFALAYLLKIAEYNNDTEALKALKEQMVGTKRQGFLFEDYKEYDYDSPLLRSHKAVYGIETIEFKIEGESFAKIQY